MYTNNGIYRFWLVRFSPIFSTWKHCQIKIRLCSHQFEKHKNYSSIPNCLCQLMCKSNCLKIEVISSILEPGCIFQQPDERSHAEGLSFCSMLTAWHGDNHVTVVEFVSGRVTTHLWWHIICQMSTQQSAHHRTENSHHWEQQWWYNVHCTEFYMHGQSNNVGL